VIRDIITKMKKQNKNIREKFVEEWGEELATAIEKAADSHRDGVNDREIGDPFKWALLICIGYQCLEKKKFRKYHSMPDFSWKKLKRWIRDNAELGTYKGDLDYLALFCGTYNYYCQKK